MPLALLLLLAAAHHTASSPPPVVHIVPHSHVDYGWRQRPDQYLHLNVRPLLRSVVRALRRDPRRRFVWESVVFLKEW